MLSIRLRFALPLLAAAAVHACGGSASETPPPLEPSPHALLSRTPSPRPTAKPVDEADTVPVYGEAPGKPAPETWSRPRRRAADAGAW